MRCFQCCLVLALASCSAADPPAGGSPSQDSSGAAGTSGTSSETAGSAGSQAATSGSGGSAGSGATVGAGGNSGAPGSGGASGGGGSIVSGSDAGFVPPTCTSGKTALPAGAPVLTSGVWKNISPPGPPWGGNPGNNDAFTQGVSIDPCNPATIYVSIVGFDPVIAKGGVYRSVDAGSTWARLGQLDEPINLEIDPKDPLHLYASDGVRGATMGFWISKNGGETWTMPDGFKSVAMSDASFDVYRVAADPADFSHVLVSFHSDWRNSAGGVLESVDSGETWKVLKSRSEWQSHGGCDVLFAYSPALGIGDKNTWLFGTQGVGYWRTTDAGVSWTKVSDLNMEHGGANVYYSQKGILYVSGSGHILRSTDNGVTMTEIAPNGGYLSVYGDGKTLYTGNHGGGPYLVASEANDTSWSSYNGGTQTFREGPFQMAHDKSNGILYGGNISGGLWVLKLP
jgi:hypothetical protein